MTYFSAQPVRNASRSEAGGRNHKVKVVLVGGCFDILHYGHIYFLKKAKKLGDILIIALESDENAKKLKGPKRPIHTQKQRQKMLESLRFVDKVIALPPMKSDTDYERLVHRVNPDIIAITYGDTKNTHGVKTFTIPKIKTPSTTQIAKLLKIERN